jgi:hypothetical protein
VWWWRHVEEDVQAGVGLPTSNESEPIERSLTDSTTFASIAADFSFFCAREVNVAIIEG